jgi:hypothetical protein
MRWSDLDELREPREYPAITILAPLQRHRPGNAEDPIRLRDLADEARARLRAELGTRGSSELVERLDAAVGSIDLRHPAEGVAVFVAPNEARVVALPFPVTERVVIDETFATRDLVRGLARTPRYRILALGEKPTRLFEGSGTELTEQRDHGFPCFVEGVRGEPLASGGFPVHTARSDAELATFFRQVERSLGAVTAEDPLPLVVAGAERDLACFDGITKHRDAIIGHLAGNHEVTTPHELARLAAPLVAQYTARHRGAVVDELVEAIGQTRGMVGIKPVWDAALAGRARVLLVEEDFVYPARVVDGHLEAAGDAGAPGVIDDAVDELIELVQDRGGDAVIVGPGALGEHGPVAALLRF